MLTISKLKPWSTNYYIDTAQAAEHAARDLARAGGEPDEYWWTGTAWYSRPFASRYSKLMIDQRPSAIVVTSVLLARFFGIAHSLRSRRSGGR
jgi:hypothetical protein